MAPPLNPLDYKSVNYIFAADTEANSAYGARIRGSIWAKHLVDKFNLFNFSGKFLAGLQAKAVKT